VSLAVAAAITVGTAFLLAGGAKVAAGSAWKVQAAALGAPTTIIPVVPWAEIAIGALLCAQIARAVIASVAAAMLVAFSALLIIRLANGQRPPCACFGSWSAKPLSWRHLVRNGVLLVAAIVAIVA
jgi:hypothetical protein